MFNFEDAFKLIPEQTIVCVGDLMLDDFVYGEVSRISPEAPAPILAVKRNELTVGGAGNVARNIAALGARCIFLGVVGEDEASRTLMRALSAEPLIEPHLVVDAERPTTRKVRFVSEHHSTHLLRADWELAKAINAKTEKVLIDRTLAALPRAASVVLSDYAKGTLTPLVIREVIDAARKAGVPIIIDPKAADYSVYRGATVIKPNRKELSEATHRRADSDAAYPVKLRDTSGAGDTVVAALAVLLATKLGYEPAVRAANAAAAVVVGKRGTSTVSAAELRSRILPAASLAPEEKIIFDWSVLDERLAEWRDMRVGFTNGCFDLLHPGHIKLLSEARAACDRLIVGLNGDASVTRLKGAGRPLQEVHARAEVLAALEAVDLVVVFDQDTPLELIRRVRPKVLVKGGDYRHEDVVGHELVESGGLLCRGWRKSATGAIADLASRAARLDRHPHRAAARSCRRSLPRALRQSLRSGLLLGGERRPAHAAACGRSVIGARSRPDGTGCATRTGHRSTSEDAGRHSDRGARASWVRFLVDRCGRPRAGSAQRV